MLVSFPHVSPKSSESAVFVAPDSIQRPRCSNRNLQNITDNFMDKLQTLKEASSYIEETLNKAGYNMNYSFYSVKPIDNIIDQQFENGRFKNSDSDFAQNGYFILMGLSSYLANVILKNSDSEIVIDENDEEWHINFKVVPDAARDW